MSTTSLSQEFEDEVESIVFGGTVSSPKQSWKKVGDLFQAAAPRIVNPRNCESIKVHGGRALIPSAAAACFHDDPERSIKFVRGLYEAILSVMQKFEERPIRVLEAGSGPYAALSMAVAAMFNPGEVEFTAIDIYDEAIDCARKVAKALGQEEKYANFIKDDASKIILPKDRLPHIIICETMMATLTDEPQIAITANLANQIIKGGYFLPENITISALLKNGRFSRRKDLGDIYVLDQSICDRVKQGDEIDEEALDQEHSVEKVFPGEVTLSKKARVIFETRVKIFGNIALGPDESTITDTRSVDISPAGKSYGVGVKMEMGRWNKGSLKAAAYPVYFTNHLSPG